LIESVLRDLQNGVTVLAPRYDFASHTRLTEWTPRSPRPCIFVEGLWPLRPLAVRELFDLRIFMDCPEVLRWQRRLARDVTGRSRTTESICDQFWNVVAPMHERFVEGQKAWADLVINQPISQSELDRLVVAVRALRSDLVPATLEIASQTATPEFATLQIL
jgi:uridine kinase